jgi:hypothetical protein
MGDDDKVLCRSRVAPPNGDELPVERSQIKQRKNADGA